MEILASIFGIVFGAGALLGFGGMFFHYRDQTQKNKLKELELKNRTLELEIEKQNNQIKLLEVENRKYDAIINESDSKKD